MLLVALRIENPRSVTVPGRSTEAGSIPRSTKPGEEGGKRRSIDIMESASVDCAQVVVCKSETKNIQTVILLNEEYTR